jgi:deazaflavin-dependent oxidoreductase (nitroreductase family)
VIYRRDVPRRSPFTSDRLLKTVNAFHESVLRITRGRLGWSADGMPVLRLTTTGRRSGQPRTVLLSSPIQFGDDWIVVGSKGGGERHADWFVNLRDDPRVTVETKKYGSREVTARIATPDEKAEWWPQAVAKFRHYGEFQSRTTRDIPMVVLKVSGD